MEQLPEGRAIYKVKSTPAYLECLLAYSRLGIWGVGFPGVSGKEPACQCRGCRRGWFDSWVRKIPWRRKWQPTPVFLPTESHGQRSLVGYNPRGHKESDMTEQLPHTHTKQAAGLLILCSQSLILEESLIRPEFFRIKFPGVILSRSSHTHPHEVIECQAT